MQLSPDKTSRSLDCVKADEQVHLLDNLQSLLEEQIEMARRSNFHRVEALAGQADSIVEKIVKTKVLEHPRFDSRREHLTKLYKIFFTVFEGRAPLCSHFKASSSSTFISCGLFKGW